MRAPLATSAVLVTLALTLSGCSLLAPDYAHEAPKGVPSDYTEPGTELEQDEVARVAFDDPEVDIAVSIRTIEERDSSLFDELDNASDFDGYTPFVVVAQYDTIDEIERGEGPSFYSLGGMLGNGEFASALVEDGSSATGSACPYSLDSTNGGDGTWRLDCMVFLVPDGEELESIGYYGYDPYVGIGFVSEIGEPFSENPITWKF